MSDGGGDTGGGGGGGGGALLDIEGLEDGPRVEIAFAPSKKPAAKKPKYVAAKVPRAPSAADADGGSPSLRKIAWSKSKRAAPAAATAPAAPPSPTKKAKKSALAPPPSQEFGVKSFAEIMADKKRKNAS
jgi:hypothetical protein